MAEIPNDKSAIPGITPTSPLHLICPNFKAVLGPGTFERTTVALFTSQIVTF